jgi:hypothetical protein
MVALAKAVKQDAGNLLKKGHKKFEVFGNIFDNPELLEVE